ncbi:MAG: 30S ribosomal protein S14 [Candidatus Aenigmatarchaeota archaeon]
MDPELRTPFPPKKKRACGRERFRCRKCNSKKGIIKKYGILLCRKCFREEAKRIGFIRFN